MANGWGGKRVGAGKKKGNAAQCHPLEPHFKKGLCLECYKNSEEYKHNVELEKRRYQAKVHKVENNTTPGLSRWCPPEIYNTLFYEQGGMCAICGSSENLCVDHCHITGTIRGLLCRHCNSGLGFFRDNAENLRLAAEYIERHK